MADKSSNNSTTTEQEEESSISQSKKTNRESQQQPESKRRRKINPTGLSLLSNCNNSSFTFDTKLITTDHITPKFGSFNQVKKIKSKNNCLVSDNCEEGCNEQRGEDKG